MKNNVNTSTPPKNKWVRLYFNSLQQRDSVKLCLLQSGCELLYGFDFGTMMWTITITDGFELVEEYVA